MQREDYLGHQDPSGDGPAQRLEQSLLLVGSYGENLARDISAEAAHAGLMSSTGHRNNILGSKFTHVGIGIVRDKRGAVIVCELFAQLIVVVPLEQARRVVQNLVHESSAYSGSSLPSLSTRLNKVAQEHAKFIAFRDKLSTPRLQGIGSFQMVALVGHQFRDMIARHVFRPAKIVSVGVGICYARSPTYPLGAIWMVLIIQYA